MGACCSYRFVVTGRRDVRTCSIANIFGWKSSMNNFNTERSVVQMYSSFE